MWLWVSWSKLNTSWTVLHFPPLRLLPIYFKNIPLPYSLKPKFGYSLQLPHHYCMSFLVCQNDFYPSKGGSRRHTQHTRRGKTKVGLLLLLLLEGFFFECLTFTPIKILFLTYPLKVPLHKLNGPSEEKFFFDNFFFLSRTWVSSFAAILPHNQLEVADAFFGGKKDSDFGSK